MSDGDAGEKSEGNVTDDGTYLVEIKRSARRRSAAAGEHVRREGRYRTFESKGLAREWAREASSPGRRVWIQDTLPMDSSPADGYLVGGRRSSGQRSDTAGSSQAPILARTDDGASE